MVKEQKFYKLTPLCRKKNMSVDELINIQEYNKIKCDKCGKLDLIDFSKKKPVFLKNKYSGNEPVDILAYDGVPIHTWGYWMIVSEKFVDWFNKGKFKGAIFYQAEIVKDEKKTKVYDNYYVMQIIGDASLDFDGMGINNMNQCKCCGAYIYESVRCPLLEKNIYPTLIDIESWDRSDIFYNSVCTERFVEEIFKSDLTGYEFNDFMHQFAGFEKKIFFSTPNKWKLLRKSKEAVKKSCNKREIEKESNLVYVSEIDDEEKKDLSSRLYKGVDIFEIEDLNDGKKIAERVDCIVNEILNTGKYLDKFESLEDVAIALGCLYGKALETGYGWSWKKIMENRKQAVYCVVSADENWMNPCIQYIYDILNRKNKGLDGENDITCMLLYNMIGDSLRFTPEKKFTIVC